MSGRPDRLRGFRPPKSPPPELRLLVEEAGRHPFHQGRRVVTPKRPRRDRTGLVLRAGLGSLGLALAFGIACGRLTRSRSAGPPEVRIGGAGHLGAFPAGVLLGSGGLFTDAAAIRDRFLATGISEEVLVERDLRGRIRVEVLEKRAVALLAGEPLLALAGDGTVLGPATVADFVWAGAPDLVVVRGLSPTSAGFAARAALAGRLAAALRSRPELDRLVSELRLEGGPLRVELVLRAPRLTVLLTENGFLERFGLVAGLLPDLSARWSGLRRIDARVPDRLLLRSEPPTTVPAAPDEGRTS